MQTRKKKLVILVHGVGKRANEWFETTDAVLTPFFRCVRFPYAEYSQHSVLALLRVAFGPYWVSGGAAVGLALLTYFWSRWALCGIALLLLGLPCLAQWLRRFRALPVNLDHFCEAQGSTSPSVICRSFGTFLVGQLLRNQRSLTQFKAVILSGCVLPRNFPWETIWQRRPCQKVWNDVDAADYVVRAAGILGRLASDLGDAGGRGFLPSGVVHKVDMPLAAHGICNDSGTTFVQNVRTDGVCHTELVKSAGYQRSCWLPFLWGMPPQDFREFLKCCEGIATHPLRIGLSYYDLRWLRREAWEECRPFFERKWSWDGRSRTIVSVLERRLREALRPIGRAYTKNKHLGVGICLLCDIVHEAAQGRGKAEALHPDVGIIEAVDNLLRND